VQQCPWDSPHNLRTASTTSCRLAVARSKRRGNIDPGTVLYCPGGNTHDSERVGASIARTQQVSCRERFILLGRRSHALRARAYGSHAMGIILTAWGRRRSGHEGHTRCGWMDDRQDAEAAPFMACLVPSRNHALEPPLRPFPNCRRNYGALTQRANTATVVRLLGRAIDRYRLLSWLSVAAIESVADR